MSLKKKQLRQKKNLSISEWLQTRQTNAYSQFGEDGIIDAVFGLIGTTNKWCLEVGAADGLFFSNTRRLIEQGWQAVLIEADRQKYDKLCRNSTAGCRCFNVEVGTTKPNTLDTILKRAGSPKCLDLISIDIDGQDWWVWDSLKEHDSRIAVVEYAYHNHSNFIPECGGPGQAGGAAMVALARKKNYEVVCMTDCNLICVKKYLLSKCERIFKCQSN